MKLTTCKTCQGSGSRTCTQCAGTGDGCDTNPSCYGGEAFCFDCEGNGEMLSLEPVLAFDLCTALFADTPATSCSIGNDRVILQLHGATVALFSRLGDGKTWAWKSGAVGRVRGSEGAHEDLDELVKAALSFPVGLATARGLVIVRLGHLDTAKLAITAAGGDPFGRTPARTARLALQAARLPVDGAAVLEASAQGGTLATRWLLEACEAVLPVVK